MTCHDAREQFSALVDGALTPVERAAVEAHLATCAECRRELQRFQDTVALVRGAAPVRAPAGFVDRVLEVARRVPWYRRLARGLFLPWPVKLPMEAAAIVLVAVGVALVYRGAREVEQSAHFDSLAPAVSRAPEGTAPQAPAPPPPRELDAARERYDARELPRSADEAQGVSKAREAKEAQEPRVAQKPEAPASGAELERAQAYLRSEPAPAAPGERADTSAARRSAPAGAGRAFAPPDVSGRLAVSDRDVALRGVAELVTRLGGVEHRRVDTADGQIVELTVPRDAYAELLRELARLGRWQPSKEPSALPAQVRVVVVIAR